MKTNEDKIVCVAIVETAEIDVGSYDTATFLSRFIGDWTEVTESEYELLNRYIHRLSKDNKRMILVRRVDYEDDTMSSILEKVKEFKVDDEAKEAKRKADADKKEKERLAKKAALADKDIAKLKQKIEELEKLKEVKK